MSTNIERPWCVCFLGDDRTLVTSRVLSQTEPKLPKYDLEDIVRVHETLTTSDLSEEVGVFEVLHTAVTDTRIEKVRAAMQHDQSMQVLIRTIQSGWPNERRRCPKQIQDFWNIRDELAIVDDESSPLVIKCHRIVIPLNSVKKSFSNFISGTSKPSNVLVVLYTGLALTQISSRSSQDARYARSTSGHHRRGPW